MLASAIVPTALHYQYGWGPSPTGVNPAGVC